MEVQPEQPVPVFENVFSEEVFNNSQPKALLVQLEAISPTNPVEKAVLFGTQAITVFRPSYSWGNFSFTQ